MTFFPQGENEVPKFFMRHCISRQPVLATSSEKRGVREMPGAKKNWVRVIIYDSNK